jgi:succinyl-CoA:acetate CoA-transferase
LKTTLKDRILNKALFKKIVNPETAIQMIRSGMKIGTAGGFQFGYPKTIFSVLAELKEGEPGFKIDLWAGGPVGDEIDGLLSTKRILRKRLGQISNSNLRKMINKREVAFCDLRSGVFPQQVRSGCCGTLDLAIIEAVCITEQGNIIPSTSLFDAATFIQMAKRIIIEINTSYPKELEGIHDVYLLKNPPVREIIPIKNPGDRIGMPSIPCNIDRISSIVEGTLRDPVISRQSSDITSDKIGRNLLGFFSKEVNSERLPKTLLPLQLGIGNIADCFAEKLADSGFDDLTVYTGGIGDGVLDLIDSGKVQVVSTSGLYFSTDGQKRFFENLDRYKNFIIIRPLDIADCPEVISRLGVIAINGAIEIDIYGHVNSTHVQGSKLIS